MLKYAEHKKEGGEETSEHMQAFHIISIKETNMTETRGFQQEVCEESHFGSALKCITSEAGLVGAHW